MDIKNWSRLMVGTLCLMSSINVVAEKETLNSLRIAMVTISTPNRHSFSQHTIKSFENYAKKWNYALYYHDRVLDVSRPVQWGKIKAVADVLKEGECDWCVWVDDDIFITNPEISFEKMIQEYGQKSDLIISAHKEKLPEFNDVNSGLFLVKNTPWSKDFLQRVWDIGNDRYNKETGSFWEQSAMQELLETKEYKNSPCITRLPARKIQSFITLLLKGDKGDYGQWQPGDFAAHLAGAGEGTRNLITEQFAKDPNNYPGLSPDPIAWPEWVKVAELYTIKQ